MSKPADAPVARLRYKAQMKSIVCVILYLALLSARASTNAPALPAEVRINDDAGCGNHLIVPVRLGTGEEIPFVVDTGSPITILDKSFEPRLKNRHGTAVIARPGDTEKANIYAAPGLYFGGARLMTGSNVFTYPFKEPRGILGMDCLRHYCIQLDFQSKRMRFLNPEDVTRHKAEWGKAFPITFVPVGPRSNAFMAEIHHDPMLVGYSTNLLVDTGCNIDGLTEESAVNRSAVLLPERRWDGNSYTNMVLAVVDQVNVLGLGFLARHLVTLDFPGGVMYLKQTSVGPIDERVDTLLEISSAQIKFAAKALEDLRKSNQLPGWSNEDKRPIGLRIRSEFVGQSDGAKGGTLLMIHWWPRPNRVTFEFQREGDLVVYHYAVGRYSEATGWRLQKAWRTNPAEPAPIKYYVPRFAESL